MSLSIYLSFSLSLSVIYHVNFFFLNIFPEKWEVPLTAEVKNWIVNQTSGYCGADMKAFCAEAALIALRRTFPQVYESSMRLKLDHSKLTLALGDFAAALRKIVPSSRRSAVSKVKPLEGIMKTILNSQLSVIEKRISVLFPPFRFKSLKPFNSISCANRQEYISRGNEFIVNSSHVQNDIWMSFLTNVSSSSSKHSGFSMDVEIGFDQSADRDRERKSRESSSSSSSESSSGDVGSSFLMNLAKIAGRPRLLIAGGKDMGQEPLCQAALHILESFPVFSLDITSLLGDSYVNSPEQALIQKVEEACRSSPSILYLPNAVTWWHSSTENMKLLICSIMESFPVDVPVLWLSTLSSEIPPPDESEDISSTFFCSPQKNDKLAYTDQRFNKMISWLSGLDMASSKTPAYKLDNFNLGPNTVIVQPPSSEVRKSLFLNFTQSLFELPAQLYESKRLYWQSYSSDLNVDLRPVVDLGTAATSAAVPSRSGVCGGGGGGGDSTGNAATLQALDPERDRQCLRELRTFLRATLAEIHKEKRTHPFWKPVDPDMVSDYYDVISYPMDLESMRMKVDEQLYSDSGW